MARACYQRYRGLLDVDWAAFLQDLGRGLSVREACELAGVSPPYAYAHRDRDDAFAAAWDAARRKGRGARARRMQRMRMGAV